MVLYLLRRVLYAVPIALAVGFVCFMLVQIAPGDPINAIVPPDAPADVVAQVRHDYGLDTGRFVGRRDNAGSGQYDRDAWQFCQQRRWRLLAYQRAEPDGDRHDQLWHGHVQAGR